MSKLQKKSLQSVSQPSLEQRMANAVRMLSMDSVQKANSGHPGMPMGMADVATVLFTKIMKYHPKDPNWADRDRFILSAGHGSMLLYSLLYLTGYEAITLDEIKNFRQLGAKTAGHPEYGHCPGVETTTGPLGQGISSAVGFALGERMMNARYGDKLVDHHTYVMAGDGCLMEGISHEAIDLAGHLKLNKLIVLWDDNSITIDGDTSVTTSNAQLARFASAGWAVEQIDGHNHDQIEEALLNAQNSTKPTLIACRTIIGYGAPNKQGTSATHGAPLGEEEIKAAREMLGWSEEPFVIPEELLGTWRFSALRSQEAYEKWNARLGDQKEAFEKDLAGTLSETLDQTLAAYKKQLIKEAPKVATRKASQMALNVICGEQTNMVGGSADLTGSNLTKAVGQTSVTPTDYSGQYIHYGVREHAMAAAMNGLALHGGAIPYGGTFLAFADYCRGAIRLSALQEQRVIYVMTHDSIGLGEDGPTHQPVEHIASLRAMPNVNVFRPADSVETLEAWQMALKSQKTPSILCLSRQGLPTLRKYNGENLTARGAYIVNDCDENRDVTLLASGSEVSLAMDAATALAKENIQACVVSMPCWELFEKQDKSYRDQVLGSAPRIAIEAASKMGWAEWLGCGGTFIGMEGFGASAPAEDLYRHFGITVDAIQEAARKSLQGE